jgi:hypothetical protein
MIITIYFDETKKSFQIIKPQTEGPNKFEGNVMKLVEHITHSDYGEGIRNYHSFDIS